MAEPPAWDRGLQQERTELSWQRTGLALLVGSATVGRLTVQHLGVAAAVAGAFASVLTLYILARVLRFRGESIQHEHEPAFSLMRDGRIPLAAAIAVSLLAAIELTASLVQF